MHLLNGSSLMFDVIINIITEKNIRRHVIRSYTLPCGVDVISKIHQRKQLSAVIATKTEVIR